MTPDVHSKDSSSPLHGDSRAPLLGWVDPAFPWELKLPQRGGVLTGVLFVAPAVFSPSMDGGDSAAWMLRSFTSWTWPS